MPYRNRSSKVLKKADCRIANMISIDPVLDLGNGLSLEIYSNQIEAARQKVAIYNTAVANLTQLYNEMLDAEQIVSDLNVRMLTGVLTKYGRNSTEYEMAGGKRTPSKRRVKSTVITSSDSSPVTPSALPKQSQQNGITNTNGSVGVVL